MGNSMGALMGGMGFGMGNALSLGRNDFGSKPCFEFQNSGTCKYGSNCTYRHGPALGGQGLYGAGAGNFGAGGMQKPCFDFQNNGTCKFGAQCRFSHTNPCFEFQKNGSCPFGSNCRFYHPKPCIEFVKEGACKYGETCRFAHITNSGANDGSASQAGSSLKPCFEFQRNNGVCKFGDVCRFSHDPNLVGCAVVESGAVGANGASGETKPCFSFMRDGKCQYGSNCLFRHEGGASGNSVQANGSGVVDSGSNKRNYGEQEGDGVGAYKRARVVEGTAGVQGAEQL